jgi:hypothetical protein
MGRKEKGRQVALPPLNAKPTRRGDQATPVILTTGS